MSGWITQSIPKACLQGKSDERTQSSMLIVGISDF